ncbi:MAG: hypothetical protein LUD47_07600 [Clostridia bacterium]|nr:hypothetical protein [Clostridia bacterium]
MPVKYQGGLGTIWKHNYILRMYKRAQIVDGYFLNDAYEDKEVLLDVQSSSSNIQHTPQGDKETKSLTSYGNFPIQTASAIQGYRADLLWYDGEWYECSSCQWYEHLPTRHWTATWQRVSESDQEPPPHVTREEADDDD